MNRPAPIACCPACGNDEDFVVKVQIAGTTEDRYSWDGTYQADPGMHEGLRYKHGKWAYCGACGKRLFAVEHE